RRRRRRRRTPPPLPSETFSSSWPVSSKADVDASRERAGLRHRVEVRAPGDVRVTAEVDLRIEAAVLREGQQVLPLHVETQAPEPEAGDRKSTRLNSSHVKTSY